MAHKLAFYRRFLELARADMQAGKSVVVTGDFNTAYAEIDIARPKENPSRRRRRWTPDEDLLGYA